jgi:plasmid stabilization system protein ParE
MQVEWLPTARRQRAAQIAYLAERSPKAALALGEALTAAVGRLAEYPEIGRPRRVATTRELVIPGTPLLLVYRLERETIVLLRLLHGSQRWPPQGVAPLS